MRVKSLDLILLCVKQPSLELIEALLKFIQFICLIDVIHLLSWLFLLSILDNFEFHVPQHIFSLFVDINVVNII
jgi:hypothetical protein